MVEARPTYSVSTRICLAILRRSLVMGIPVILLAGFFASGAFQSLGNTGANAVAWLAAFVAAILVQSFCIQLAPGQDSGRARLVLVASADDTDA